MGVVHDPYWEERAQRDVVGGMAKFVTANGSGSISCLAITEDDASEAQARRGPLGFAPAPVSEDWGEAAWTARDVR